MNSLTKTGLILVISATIVLMAYFWDFIPSSVIALCVVIGVGVISYNLIGADIQQKLNRLTEKRLKDSTKRVGLYINVIWWNILVRSAISLMAGITVTIILMLTDSLLGANIMNGWISAATALGATLFFAQSEKEDEVVPEAHGAMLTFWGMRFRAYRREGHYSWTGKLLGLGRSQTVHTEGTDKNGFIKLQPFPISIWNQMDEKGKVRLESLALDSSEVTTTLTLTITLQDPYLWIDSADPALDLAEQTRTAFRTAISFFTGVDCALVKSVFVNLMAGLPILSVFLPKTIEGYPKGSILRNRAGVPMYIEIQQGSKEATVRKKFTQVIVSEADSKMLEECTSTDKSKGVDFHIEKRTVESAFSDVLKRLGVKLVKAAVGNIDLSKEVTTEANKAASEVFQREAQIISAKTTAASIEILDKATKNVSDLVAAIAASKDYPGVKVVVTGSGDDSLKSAAATHATLTSN